MNLSSILTQRPGEMACGNPLLGAVTFALKELRKSHPELNVACAYKRNESSVVTSVVVIVQPIPRNYTDNTLTDVYSRFLARLYPAKEIQLQAPTVASLAYAPDGLQDFAFELIGAVLDLITPLKRKNHIKGNGRHLQRMGPIRLQPL